MVIVPLFSCLNQTCGYPGINGIRMDKKQRREELGGFLRAKRARITLAEVGLLGSGRRRTPGLRREEAAELAGVGVAWYTWLEQGRDIHVSAVALEGISAALRLSQDERAHLFLLARREMPLEKGPVLENVGPILQRVLDRQGDPAYVTNARRDVLAWNKAACAVFGDFRALSPARRNILRRLFLDPAQRRFHVHWEEDARDVLARFRVDAGICLGDPDFAALVTELEAASPEFRSWWPQYEVARKPRGRKEFLHPQAGRLVMEYTALQLIDQPGLRLVVFTPLPDEDTIMKLAHLLSPPDERQMEH